MSGSAKEQIPFADAELSEINGLLAEDGEVGGIKTVLLDWYEEGETVTVVPRDLNRFEIQKDFAIEILRKGKQAELFQKQFRYLLGLLAKWMEEHKEKIERGYLTIHEGTLAFVVVRREAKYDEEFLDALLNFDFDLSVDAALDLVKVRTIDLPHVGGEALASFLDPRLLLTYGERSRSHPAGQPQP